MNKNFLILLVLVILIVVIGIYFVSRESETPAEEQPTTTPDEKTEETHKDYKQVLSSKLAYSNGEQKIRRAPGEIALPYYFNKDSKDNIYIADLLGQIKVFDSSGNFEFSFQPQGSVDDLVVMEIDGVKIYVVVNDLAFDEKDNLYIKASLSTGSYLLQYEPEYTLPYRKRIPIHWEELPKTAFSAIYIINNKIYIPGAGQDSWISYLIGVIDNGILKETPLAEFQGILGSTSGNWYKVEITEKFKKGTITILDSSGTVLRTIILEREGLVSMGFLGEDQNGNIYIQIEKTKESGTGVELEVHKFDSVGNSLTILSIPNTNYTLWSNKLLLVSKDGTVWQVLPADDGWYINKWSTIY